MSTHVMSSTNMNAKPLVFKRKNIMEKASPTNLELSKFFRKKTYHLPFFSLQSKYFSISARLICIIFSSKTRLDIKCF